MTTAQITLEEAVARLREAADLGTADRCEDAWADGGPDIPDEGRCYVDPQNRVGVDFPTIGLDGTVEPDYHELGVAPGLHREVTEAMAAHRDRCGCRACEQEAAEWRATIQDVAGLSEIAEALGMSRDTVKGWSARGLLDPFRVGTVSGAPAFDLAAVRQWFETTPPRPGRPRKQAVVDPLGLRRCASCGNAFEHDRLEDGRCGHCGGRFDPE